MAREEPVPARSNRFRLVVAVVGLILGLLLLNVGLNLIGDDTAPPGAPAVPRGTTAPGSVAPATSPRTR
jgi:hypothetical protein